MKTDNVMPLVEKQCCGKFSLWVLGLCLAILIFYILLEFQQTTEGESCIMCGAARISGFGRVAEPEEGSERRSKKGNEVHDEHERNPCDVLPSMPGDGWELRLYEDRGLWEKSRHGGAHG